MQKRTILISVIALVIIVVAGLSAWKLGYFKAQTAPYQIEMAAGETVSSWNFQGAYTDNAELVTKAKENISRLTGLLGSEKFPDYTLYVSIANQYDLLGDGKNELLYLERALALDSTVTGLAWHNAGQLFARLGAYATARMALEQAVAIQPITQYKEALADFVAKYPQSAKAVTGA